MDLMNRCKQIVTDWIRPGPKPRVSDAELLERVFVNSGVLKTAIYEVSVHRPYAQVAADVGLSRGVVTQRSAQLIRRLRDHLEALPHPGDDVAGCPTGVGNQPTNQAAKPGNSAGLSK